MAAKPIVAGTDGSEESLRAVGWAAREAVLRGAPLRIVAAAAVLPRMISRAGPGQYDTVTDVLDKERDSALAVAAERAAKAAHGVLIDTDPLTGPPAQAIVESGSGALMLVVGSRGAGAFTALTLGSVSRYAAVHAACPVVVIRDLIPVASGLVGVGVGDLEDCTGPLTFAFEEASLRKAEVLAVHAWAAPESATAEAGARLAELMGSWADKYPGVPVSQEVVPGYPARVLVGLSARADLMVMGRHGEHPGPHGPGPVRHAVLSHAHGPVVTVPSA